MKGAFQFRSFTKERIPAVHGAGWEVGNGRRCSTKPWRWHFTDEVGIMLAKKKQMMIVFATLRIDTVADLK